MDSKCKITKSIIYFCLFFFAALLWLPGLALAQTHTVSKGDSVYKIAGYYNVSQYALRFTNNLWTNSVYPGQKLTIPQKYMVQKGDNLSLIGKKFGVDYRKITAANGLKTDSVYPGQTLYIPVGQAVNNTGSNTNTSANTNINKNNTSKNNSTSSNTNNSKNNSTNNNNNSMYITTSRGSFSRTEFDVLARIITAEADSESYATQVAVGAVVLNRLDSPLFPNTIRGVVYQVDAGGKYQFSPVLNGWINHPASQTGEKAAMDALNGWDPTNGAMYFWESWVTNKYLTARQVAVKLGAFTFTY